MLPCEGSSVWVRLTRSQSWLRIAASLGRSGRRVASHVSRRGCAGGLGSWCLPQCSTWNLDEFRRRDLDVIPGAPLAQVEAAVLAEGGRRGAAGPPREAAFFAGGGRAAGGGPRIGAR